MQVLDLPPPQWIHSKPDRLLEGMALKFAIPA